MFVLETDLDNGKGPEKDETAQGGNSPERLGVSDGSDGSRAIARREGWYRPRPRVDAVLRDALPEPSAQYAFYETADSATIVPSIVVRSESLPEGCHPAEIVYPWIGEPMVAIIDELHVTWSDLHPRAQWAEQSITMLIRDRTAKLLAMSSSVLYGALQSVVCSA